MTSVKVFLFTDLESSTRRWEADAEAMSAALARHDAIIGAAIAEQGGKWFKHTGDGACAAFDSAIPAVQAAADIQSALQDEPMLTVRIGVHAGPAESRGGDWFGPTLNRCARLMSAAHGGQTILSDDVARELRGAFPLRDLGEHRLRDLEQALHIFQLGDAPFPPLQSLSTIPTNLPAQRSTFVGRTSELSRIGAALERARLVTLIGVGGTGKTRLALHAAAEASVRFPDGVFVVELSPLRDPLQVPRAVAEAVGAYDGLVEAGTEEAAGAAGAATERLVRWATERRVLLVLDNCEHLIGAVARLVDELLAAAKDLVLLATSREPLMVEGEHIFPVPGLDEAVQLFEDRARAARPDFGLTAENREVVEGLCVRLDGIPLAIELAAARLRALSLEQISRRLDDTFRLLSGGSRTAMERHQTLAGTIRWSYDLLSPEEQLLFTRLGVFVGGCTLDAIEQVCSEGLTAEIVDLVQQLVDKSLLVFDDHGDTVRYRMLEIVRQYAAGLLSGSAEVDAVRDRHLRWAIRLVRPVSTALTIDWDYHRVLAAEHDNLALAFRRAIDSGDARRALDLAVNTAIYWRSVGSAVLGRSWLEEALEASAGDETLLLLRGLAFTNLVNLRQLAGDYVATIDGFERAARNFREIGVPLGEAYARFGGARTLGVIGRLEDAEAAYDEAEALFRQLGDEPGRGWARFNRSSHLFLAGRFSDAAAIADALVESGADVVGMEPYEAGLVLSGACRMLDGDVASGRERYRAGLALARNNVVENAYFSYIAASVELDLDADGHQADSLMRTSLEEARRGGAWEIVQGQLEATAVIAWRRGDHRMAAALLAAAAAIPERTGVVIGCRREWPPARSAAADVQAQLTSEALRDAEAIGRAWSLSEAVEAALGALREPAVVS